MVSDWEVERKKERFWSVAGLEKKRARSRSPGGRTLGVGRGGEVRFRAPGGRVVDVFRVPSVNLVVCRANTNCVWPGETRNQGADVHRVC